MWIRGRRARRERGHDDQLALGVSNSLEGRGVDAASVVRYATLESWLKLVAREVWPQRASVMDLQGRLWPMKATSSDTGVRERDVRMAGVCDGVSYLRICKKHRKRACGQLNERGGGVGGRVRGSKVTEITEAGWDWAGMIAQVAKVSCTKRPHISFKVGVDSKETSAKTNL